MFINFIPAGGVYTGETEIFKVNGKIVPGFEIFADVYDFLPGKIFDISLDEVPKIA